MTNSVELEPCPFCGSEAISGTTLDDAAYVMCISENCWGMVGYLPTEELAITAWNTRSLRPAEDAPEPGGTWSDGGKCWDPAPQAAPVVTEEMTPAARDLLASLDPDALNPEQFNAWCALTAALGGSNGQ